MFYELFISLCLCFISYADSDGPYTLMGVSGYSGNIVINSLTNASYFYWLFEKQGGNIFLDSAPLLIWLDGGPGSASEDTILQCYVTPFYVNDLGELALNGLPQTWISFYHVMMIDNPIGVGYSYTSSNSDMLNTTAGSSAQLYKFLQRITQKYPTWLNGREVYFIGHSAAGTWIPAIAYKVLMENKAINVTGNNFINLVGIALGDPFIDFRYQGIVYANASYDVGLVNTQQKIEIEAQQDLGMQYLNSQNYSSAWHTFTNIIDLISQMSDGNFVYDVRVYNYTGDFGQITEFMNNSTVKSILHAPDFEYSSYNVTVSQDYGPDFAVGISNLFPYILDNIKVLVFNGQDDLVINGRGTEDVLKNLQWQFTSRFNRAPKHIWKVNGNIAGYATAYGTLTYLAVLKAGHVVLQYQPTAVRDMLARFIGNKGWD